MADEHGYWTPDIRADVNTFHAELGRVVNIILRCRQRGDRPGTERWVLRLIAARDFCRREPLINYFDHAMACALFVMGEWDIIDGDYAAAFSTLKRGWDVLETKDARRRRHGLPARPSTEARLWLLAALADAKWHAGDDYYGSVLTPAQMAARWLGYCDHFADWVRGRGFGQRERERVDGLLSAGAWVLACAHRWEPDQVLRLTARFNHWHQQAYGCACLALAPGHFRDEPPLGKEKTWYWLNEIVKVYELARQGKRGRLRQDEVGWLYDKLVEAHWREHPNDVLLAAGFMHDRDWMSERLRRKRLEVVSA